jgi:hypothetical protein
MKHQNSQHPFYTRVQNLSQVPFTLKQLELLSKVLQYNLHYKYKTRREKLALQAGTAIGQMNITDQEYVRQFVNKNLITLLKNNNTYNNNKTKQEWNIIKNLKQNIEDNIIITQADKGKTVVVAPKQQYREKITDFIHNNTLPLLQQDPTQEFQRKRMTTINQRKDTIPKERKHRH